MLREFVCKRRFFSTLGASLCCIVVSMQIISPLNQVLGFHLSFNHRLLKSVTNPQLNPANTLIRPVECRNANNHSEAGICMFSIDCMQNKGVPLSICKHNYFVGTCCRLPDYNNFVGIVYDLRDTETNQLVEARGIPPVSPQLKLSTVDSILQSRTAVPVGGISGSSSISSTTGSSTISNLEPRTSESSLLAMNLVASSTTAPSSSAKKDSYSEPPLSTTQLPVTKSTTQTTRAAAAAALSSERLDEKYIISSTNLFPSTINPLPTTQLDSALILAQPQPPAQQQLVALKDSLKLAPATSGESARNSDGGLPSSFIISSLATSQSNNKQQQFLVPSELDSFQIQTTSTTAVNANQGSQNLLEIEHHQQDGGNANKKFIASPQNVYDLIKTDNESLEILSTLSSVHSAPTTQQQFNIELQNSVAQDSVEASYKPRPTGSSQQEKVHARPQQQQQQQQQNSIYSLIDTRLGPKNNLPQQNIVFANNHQLQSSTLRPPPSLMDASSTKMSSLQPLSDQEFTLSSVPHSTSGQQQEEQPNKSPPTTVWLPASSSPPLLTASSTTLGSEATLQAITNLSTTSSATPLSQPASISLPQAPFVDLVSSGNSAQATTPFTTSLSTALLPNVSSHPYNPTTSAPQLSSPSSLVPSLVNQIQFSPNATSFSSLSANSSSHLKQQQVTNSSGGGSQKPNLSASDLVTTNLLAFGQLYSSQHAASTVPNPNSNSNSNSNSNNKNKPYLVQQDDYHHSPSSSMAHVGNRPNLILASGVVSPTLHAATKIVSGGSSTNHLLPGLSNLQSAILNNIPYKLASHLSSGLSSYFQTAMKPAAGSRPLLSSNTAPSLQYQQQMQQQQQLIQNQANNSSKTTQANISSVVASTQQQLAAPGIIKFPISSSSSSSSALSPSQTLDLSGSSANSAETTISPVAGWQFGGLTSASKPPQPIVRDVVKEAQQICGRPQVSQPHSNQLIGEGGKKRVARIVGGNQSSFGQWPWMVSLRQWRKGAFLHKCGAALLNENWAITAAHCVENVKVTDLLLRLGEFDVSNQEEPFPFAERRVKSVVSHPSFDPKTFEHDLALLRFEEPIKYERNIIPVCVPAGNDSYVDRMATVIGWGRLYEDGPLPDVIQHVDVPIITNNECEKMYKNAGFIEEIPDMFICAGISKGGRDSCEGDSGGPLTMIDHDGRSYLVGIISWGIGCALPSQPGVYTRITAFSGWINQITAY